jgi:hypothetical protein
MSEEEDTGGHNMSDQEESGGHNMAEKEEDTGESRKKRPRGDYYSRYRAAKKALSVEAENRAREQELEQLSDRRPSDNGDEEDVLLGGVLHSCHEEQGMGEKIGGGESEIDLEGEQGMDENMDIRGTGSDSGEEQGMRHGEEQGMRQNNGGRGSGVDLEGEHGMGENSDSGGTAADSEEEEGMHENSGGGGSGVNLEGDHGMAEENSVSGSDTEEVERDEEGVAEMNEDGGQVGNGGDIDEENKSEPDGFEYFDVEEYFDAEGGGDMEERGGVDNASEHSGEDQEEAFDGLGVDGDEEGNDEEGNSSDDEEVENVLFSPLQLDLLKWALDNKITGKAFTALLKLLKLHIADHLPKDCRSLRRSPRKASQCAKLKKIGTGKYFHFKLSKVLLHILRGFTSEDFSNENIFPRGIEIQLFLDGVVRFDSARNQEQFWPILVRVWKVLDEYKGVLDREVGVVGLFYGRGKPSDCSEYLYDLLLDLHALLTEGLKMKNREGGKAAVPVHLDSFIADHQARCYVKCTKNSTGFGACERCDVEGVSYGKKVEKIVKGVRTVKTGKKTVVFLKQGNPRTDESFRKQTHKSHHTGESPLVRLRQLDMVFIMSLDYMHMVCQGVVKRLLIALFDSNSKSKRKLPPATRVVFSDVHKGYGDYSPVEFQRKPAALSDRSSWKGTQFRHFICCTAAPLLAGRQGIASKVKKNIMLLYCAMRILCDQDRWRDPDELEKAQIYISKFADHSKVLYGKEFSSFNVHSVHHLPGEVAYHQAPLDDFSAFIAESSFGPMLRLIAPCANNLPAEQLVKRIWEKRLAQKRDTPGGAKDRVMEPRFQFSRDRDSKEDDPDNVKVYAHLKITGAYTLKCEVENDSFAIVKLENGEKRYIKCERFLVEDGDEENGFDGQMLVEGKELVLVARELFGYPRAATSLGIELFSGVQQYDQNPTWSVNQIVGKLVRLPTEKGFPVVLPMLHGS